MDKDAALSPSKIGLYAETALHATLKKLYATSIEAKIEEPFAGRIVDIVMPDELIEIQTRNIAALNEKALSLACYKPLRIVHPIVVETNVTRLAPDSGEIISTLRRKTGRNFYNFFNELVHSPIIVASPNISFDVLTVSVDEVRMRDENKTKRKKKEHVISRHLNKIEKTWSFNTKTDWLKLIPDNIQEPFSSTILAKALGIKVNVARQILYTFSRANLITHIDTVNRKKLYCKV